MPDSQHSRELRERRADLGNQLGDIVRTAHSEDRVVTGEERQKMDAINSDIDQLKIRIDDMEAVETFEKEMSAPVAVQGQPGAVRLDDGRTVVHRPADTDKVITYRDEDMAFRAISLGEHASDKMREAADKCKYGLNAPKNRYEMQMHDSMEYEAIRQRFRRDGIVYRATTLQSKGTTTAGGHTVPVSTVAAVEEALLYYGGVREMATVIRTEGGEDLRYPTGDDTDAFSSVKTENSAATVSNLVFGLVTLRAATFNTGVVRASMELVQDTAIDLSSYVGKQFGIRHGRGMNREFTTGSTATTTPRGFIRDSSEGYAATTATGGDIGIRPLTELFYSVDREIRDQPGAGWTMHDGVAKEVRYLVDSNGQPLWGAGLRSGEPDTIMMKPVHINNRLTSSTTGAGAATMYFGDLSRYLIRDVIGTHMVTFQERFADSFQIGWIHFMRSDGALLVASTRTASDPIKHLKGTT